MTPHFEYKGYSGSAEVSIADNLLHGRLLFITDIVSYVADTPQQLKAAFEEAVDDYLQTCAELGDEPNRPFKGSFNVRLGPDRHKRAALAAISQGKTLNEWMCIATDAALKQEPLIATNHVTVKLYASQSEVKTFATNARQLEWVATANTASSDAVRH